MKKMVAIAGLMLFLFVGQGANGAEQAKDEKNLLYYCERHYKKLIAKKTKVLQKQIDALDKDVYAKKRAAMQSMAATCVLSPEAQKAVKALPDWEKLRVKAAGKFRDSRDRNKVWRAADAVYDTLTGAMAQLKDDAAQCLVAHSKVNSKGILVSGFHFGATKDQKNALKHLIVNEGWVFVLWPQMITAWPGVKESVVGILDPTQGPWKVRIVSTVKKGVSLHDEKWMFQRSILAEDFLKLRKQRYGHFLVLDKADEPLGWLDRKGAIFYRGEGDFDEKTQELFVKGVAAAIDGVYYFPASLAPQGECKDPGGCEGFDGFAWFDFSTMTSGSGYNKWVQNVYLSKMKTLSLARMRLGKIDRVYKNSISTDLEENPNLGRGFSYGHGPGTGYYLSGARTRFPHFIDDKAKKVPIERLLEVVRH